MIKFTKMIPFALLAAVACGPNAAQLASKTAADGAAAVACVTKDWGKPPLVVAADCFNDELSLAQDAIAEGEALLQHNGAAPTKAYMADAVITQKVLMKKAALEAAPQ